MSGRTPTDSYIPKRDSDCVQKALEILRGKQASPKELLDIAEDLKRETRFNYARRLLMRARNHDEFGANRDLRLRILQRLALCTYKDQDLEPDERFKRALATLNEAEDLEKTTNQETLGMLGAIYKRMWELDNQRANLDRSLAYYLRGYNQGVENDQGYTGINAAFVLDQLTDLIEQEAVPSEEESAAIERRRALATKIRSEITLKVAQLLDDSQHQWLNDKWWYYATIAEAHFGLGNYNEAVEWLLKGKKAAGPVYEWELETCARQLASLARFRSKGKSTSDFAGTEPWDALKRAFGADAVPRNAFMGKIGLALSGGGLRASLYHLGVLARLAELGVLQHVEVLSCVSGGSIVGAYYYLKVRQLLETSTEQAIDNDRQLYIEIVDDLIREFVPAIQKNIRTRVVLNPFKTLRMVGLRGYSRTHRAGELYERYLYSRVKDVQEDSKIKDPEKRQPKAGTARPLNKLTIAPLLGTSPIPTWDTEFSPKYHNWRRNAKVPILVINAATLNTGHTWQFTASWMGESPTGIDTEIDGNDRLRRMYYGDAPKPYNDIRLGDAVGASAAVPGVFEPISLDGLYPDRIVRLVDGGACDNQGVASLLEQDCRVILVSDGSGQMESQRAPGGGILSVLLRSNTVVQARVRQAEYHDLKGRRRSGFLKGLMFVHLKGDLDVDPVDWNGCLDPYDASDDARPAARRGPLTRYGVHKEIQQSLSAIRTDLDSFSDAEAYALMVSGYRMTEYQFRHGNCVAGFSEPDKPHAWKFLEIEESMKGKGDDFTYLKTLLDAGSSSAFKVWRIDPVLKYGLRFALVAFLFVVAFALKSSFNDTLPDFVVSRGTATLDSASKYLADQADSLPSLTYEKITTAIVGLFSGYIFLRILGSLVGDRMARDVVRLTRAKDWIRRAALAAVLSTVGCVAAFIHIHVFDWRFLKVGSLDAVKAKRS